LRKHAGRVGLEDAADEGEAAAGGLVETTASWTAGSGGTFSQLDPSERSPQKPSDMGTRGVDVRNMMALS
jgi:hypothetical protein